MADDMNARTSYVATKRPSDGATSKKRKHNFTHALYPVRSPTGLSSAARSGTPSLQSSSSSRLSAC